jgi:hypothetical protein
MENFRVVPIDDQPGEWKLIADVHLTRPDIDDALGGFSFAFTANYRSNAEVPSGHVYLPYPYYNDELLIDEFLNTDLPLQVGKWHKKAADPGTTALIVAGIAFVFTPVWKRVYDDYVHPFLVQIAKKCIAVGKNEITYEYGQSVTDSAGHTVNLYFVPDRFRNWDTLQPHLIKNGLEKVETFLNTDPDAARKGASLIKLYYHDDSRLYVIFYVQFRDGSFKNYG